MPSLKRGSAPSWIISWAALPLHLSVFCRKERKKVNCGRQRGKQIQNLHYPQLCQHLRRGLKPWLRFQPEIRKTCVFLNLASRVLSDTTLHNPRWY